MVPALPTRARGARVAIILHYFNLPGGGRSSIIRTQPRGFTRPPRHHSVAMSMRQMALLLALAAGGPAWGQAAAAYDPQGVQVDANGVLRSRTSEPDARLAELWKNAKTLQK